MALGSNRGDRAENLRYGLRELERRLVALRTSRVYRSAPAEGAGGTEFLNMCGAGRLPDASSLAPRDLMGELLGVEMGAGRPLRREPRTPRTLDLDLLLVGDRRAATPELSLPHPRLTERPFVLLPLAELLPEWRHPGTGRTVRRHAREAGGDGVEPFGVDELA